jgi:hypothetical protein
MNIQKAEERASCKVNFQENLKLEKIAKYDANSDWTQNKHTVIKRNEKYTNTTDPADEKVT